MQSWPKDSLAVGTNKAGSNSQWCQKRFKNNAYASFDQLFDGAQTYTCHCREVEWMKPA